MIKVFEGYRPSPPPEYLSKGLTNSGEKPDYEGVVFSTGVVAIKWLTQYNSITIYNSWDDFWNITGHPDYGTRIEWISK